ncbi:MAG: CD225/dispanin family protein [Actinomycetota bacterium]|nr:CD225/dispanin family protein [Actinomycetota bacterium]
MPSPNTEGAGFSAGSAAGLGASVPNIPNYLVQAVLLTLVCFVLSPFTLFFPFLGVITGIVAIVYGAQVNGKVAGNNYAGARESSRMARVCSRGGRGKRFPPS